MRSNTNKRLSFAISFSLDRTLSVVFVAALVIAEVTLILISQSDWRWLSNDSLLRIYRSLSLSEHFSARKFFIAFCVGAIFFYHRSVKPQPKQRWTSLSLSVLAWQLFFAGGMLFLIAANPLFHSSAGAFFAHLLFCVLAASAASYCALRLLFSREIIRHHILCVVPGLLVGLLFAIATYWLSVMTKAMWYPLSDITFFLVSHELKLLLPEATVLPESRIISTDNFSVPIHPFCSGYEGVGLMWAFLGFYTYFSRKHLAFPRALWLFPIGTVIVWVSNSFRISLLFLIGHFISVGIAEQGFHQQSGWLLFISSSLFTVLLSEKWGYLRRNRSKKFVPKETDPSLLSVPALLLPIMALILSSMGTGAFLQDETQWYFPARIIAVAAVLFFFRKSYCRLITKWPTKLSLFAAIALFFFWLYLGPTSETLNEEWKKVSSGLTPPWSSAWLYFRLAGYTLFSPIAEELAFRIFLIPAILALKLFRSERLNMLFACFLSSLFFSIFHAGWIATFLAGLVFSGVYFYRRNFLDPIVAHIGVNLLLCLYCLTVGSWTHLT